VEFIPRPFQILDRVRSAPDRWSNRIGALGLGSKVAPLLDDAAFYGRTAFPGLKKAGLRKGAAMGTGKFLGKALPITSQLYGAYEGTKRLIQGQPLHKVGLGYGYALPGPWGWANFAADMAVPGVNSPAQNPQISNISPGNPIAELVMRKQQGAYIPIGMGVPAQPGGDQRFNLGGKGGSNLVGENSTWTDRNNNVVAPLASDVFSDHQNSNVFTPHYETGEPLGVMTRNQRRAYEESAAAAGF